MEKSLSAIIQHERGDSRNGDTDSIPDIDFVRWNQYAQTRLVSLISKSYNWVFLEDVDIPLEANEAIYDLNRNVVFGTRIVEVRYSFDGQEKNFIRLTPTPDRYVRIREPGTPIFYRRRNGAVEVEPAPATTRGTLRVTYERQRDAVDIQRGKVVGVPAGAVINLVDPFAGGDLTAETQSILTASNKNFKRYICISNLDGRRLLTNGVISSSSTTSVTLAADVSTYLESGVTLANLENMMLTTGKYSSTHSELTDECEPYLVEYTNRRCMNRDSSADWDTVDSALQEIERDIVSAYNIPDKDRKLIPISNWEMLIPEYE